MSRALDSTVELITWSGDTYCTGFIVERVIVTAAHCAEGVFSIIRNPEGETYYARVVARNDQLDAAALVPTEDRRLGRGLKLARLAPEAGDEVFAVGHSLGVFTYSVTKGVVSNAKRSGFPFIGMTWMQHDAGTVGGNSGGPVLNSRGDVVGITSFIIVGTHISGAIHLEVLESLLAAL